VQANSTAPTIAARLADWVIALRYQDLPADAVFHAKRCMLDTLGVQIRGATLPWVQPVYRYIRSTGGAGEATVSYHGDRLSAPYAAYINSTFAYSSELQHHGTWGSAHTGVIVNPTVMALGEQLGSSGEDIIAALVAGYEVQGRVGLALFQPAFERNFHPQPLLGVFSSAASAGKLLGLTVEQQAHAFAIAGSHASGILEYDQAGGEVKRIHGAIAARCGIQSAFLAKEGFTGPPTVFEGRRGIFASFGGGEAKPDAVFADIGKPYCITQCRFRVYPTIGSCHNTLDIVNDLITAHAFDYREIESFNIGMRELSVLHVGTARRPHDVISAQASLAYSLGVRLVKGSNDLEMYMDPALWRDPEVLAVADKLHAYPLNTLPEYRDKVKAHPHMTKVEIRFKDGRVLSGEQEDARGSDALPFSDEVLENKFRRLAGALLPKGQVENIMQTVARLETLPSIRPLVAELQKR
jgi:2-methylcitrate dehydratase PrpD